MVLDLVKVTVEGHRHTLLGLSCPTPSELLPVLSQDTGD